MKTESRVTHESFVDEFEKISRSISKMMAQSSCSGFMPAEKRREALQFEKSIGPGKQVVAAIQVVNR